MATRAARKSSGKERACDKATKSEDVIERVGALKHQEAFGRHHHIALSQRRVVEHCRRIAASERAMTAAGVVERGLIAIGHGQSGVERATRLNRVLDPVRAGRLRVARGGRVRTLGRASLVAARACGARKEEAVAEAHADCEAAAYALFSFVVCLNVEGRGRREVGGCHIHNGRKVSPSPATGPL